MVGLKEISVRTSEASWPPALTDLYRHRSRDLVRVAYLMTGRREIAEELTHDAFVAALPHFEEILSPYAYLRRAVVNNVHSWHRRRLLENRQVPDPPEPILNEPDEMWDALGRLDYRNRAAIVLRFYEQLPDAEIAEVLGCARATVRTLVRRGLAELRTEITR